jgi:hypothetical protein
MIEFKFSPLNKWKKGAMVGWQGFFFFFYLDRSAIYNLHLIVAAKF